MTAWRTNTGPQYRAIIVTAVWLDDGVGLDRDRTVTAEPIEVPFGAFIGYVGPSYDVLDGRETRSPTGINTCNLLWHACMSILRFDMLFAMAAAMHPPDTNPAVPY